MDLLKLMQEELERLRQDGTSYRKLEKKFKISFSTLEKIHKGKERQPSLETIKRFFMATDQDTHQVAHFIFELPGPEDMGELEGTLAEVCEAVKDMPEEDRLQVLGAIKLIKGGDPQVLQQAAEPRQKYG